MPTCLRMWACGRAGGLLENIAMMGLITSALTDGAAGRKLQTFRGGWQEPEFVIDESGMIIVLPWAAVLAVVVTAVCLLLAAVFLYARRPGALEPHAMTAANSSHAAGAALVYISPAGKRAHLYQACDKVKHVAKEDLRVYPICHWCQKKARYRSTVERE